jgi:multidrug resistance protein, MATE family
MSRNGTAPQAIEPTSASAASPPPAEPLPGGSKELLGLATPLIVSQSFMTVQVFVDAVLLSRHDP